MPCRRKARATKSSEICQTPSVRTRVRTKAGALGRCPTLPSRLDLRAVARAVPTDGNARWFMDENLRAAERRIDPAGVALAAALRRALEGNVAAARFRRDLRDRVVRPLRGTVAEAPLRRLRRRRAVKEGQQKPRSSP